MRIDKIRYYIVFATLLLIAMVHQKAFSGQTGPERGGLHFNKARKFRIAQFTDIHWKVRETEKSDKTAKLIREILKVEQPDLIVLTGDVVNEPADEGWKTLMPVFTASGIPFAVTLGNHDHESNWTRDQIFDYLATLPNFIGQKGPEGISGVGNYILEVNAAHTEQVAALLYFFDSHANSSDRERVSDYDWIKFDQIAAYREQSTLYTLKNGGKPYPALAFFHIPLPEYKEIKEQPTTIGERNEKVCSPLINSGLLTSFIEMNDVMGCFVGHDHNNNYSGIYKGVGLNYGQSSGYSGYGTIGKGARIIELQEGNRGYNTWVRSDNGSSLYYNYPLGASFRDKDYHFHAAKKVTHSTPGLIYKYVEGSFQRVEEISDAQPLKLGVAREIASDIVTTKGGFGLEFTGLIKIPSRDIYRFFATGGDSVRLYIGGKLVANHDGAHGMRETEGFIALEKGYHDIKLIYLNAKPKKRLSVSMMSLGRNKEVIGGSMLFHAD